MATERAQLILSEEIDRETNKTAEDAGSTRSKPVSHCQIVIKVE
jgi:hypothetical protein